MLQLTLLKGGGEEMFWAERTRRRCNTCGWPHSLALMQMSRRGDEVMREREPARGRHRNRIRLVIKVLAACALTAEEYRPILPGQAGKCGDQGERVNHR